MAAAEPGKPKAKTHKAHRKVFDIVPPGKSPASPNSRSVIVGHKPQVQDDQFMPEHTSHWAGDPSEKRPLMSSHKKIGLSPDGPKAGEKKGADEASAPIKASAAKSESTEKEDTQIAVGATTAPALPLKKRSPSQSEEAEAPASEVGASTEKRAAGSGNASGASRAPGSDSGEAAPIITPTAPPMPNATHNAGMATSEHLADLAVEQVVEAPLDDDTAPDSSLSGPLVVEGDENPQAGSKGKDGVSGASPASSPPPPAVDPQPKTNDDLLAETSAPDLAPQKAIVSTHRHHLGAGKVLLIIFLILVIAAVALDLLLDAGVIETQWDVRYTDLIN